MVKVKICGITNVEDALCCIEEGADALGFIFWRKSPRFVSPPVAKRIAKDLRPFVWKVGVFVNEDRDRVERIATHVGLDVLQFHGDESPAYCNSFRSRFYIIKTLFPDSKMKWHLSKYNVDAYLLDVRWEKKVKEELGIDEEFVKDVVGRFREKVLISGGLTPENVKYYVKKFKPYGVDVARGVELFPGRKDINLVRKFIRNAKKI